MHTALQQSLLALGLMAGLATGFGWTMAGRVLYPLQRITGTARRVADRGLHERIDLQGPQDEFKELADTFDAMLRGSENRRSSAGRWTCLTSPPTPWSRPPAKPPPPA